MTLHAINLRNIQAQGELRDRIEASLTRLEADDFRPERVYRVPEYDWPGDQEGRTLLALVMLAQGTGREPRYMRDIIARIDGALNDRGYFGKALPHGEIDEQQLAGNSWFLRSLCEYYEWTKDEPTLRRIETLARNLILPTQGAYARYPARPDQRVFAGEASGTLLSGMTDGWYLSTDIGCAFIMLDGASHAYRLLGWPELGETIEEMIGVFAGIDFLAASMQTHATLSGLRGMLRYCDDSGDESILQRAQTIYALYTDRGMTENYANYNWFGRPDWTEPCAVVDSFLVAVDLWRLSGRTGYLNDAQAIYYNGIGHGQRPNGGFGCDFCSGAREPYLYPLANVFEAWWCCTMRGGDGLARASSYTLFVDDDTIAVPFFHSAAAGIGDANIVIESGFPLEGRLRIGIDGNTHRQWRIFLPDWIDRDSVTLLLDGVTGKARIVDEFVVVEGARHSIEIRFAIGLREESVVGSEALPGAYRSFRYGALVLGLRDAEEEILLSDGYAAVPGEQPGHYRLTTAGTNDEGSKGHALEPFHDLFRMNEEQAVRDKKQILFRPI
ncbi:hypothetical protein [Cohnella sp. GCM10027633]|uniref:hypothetical protein n=1 Tax=unclassified Cohnella TaxID=2636738 RepID=UPI003631D731